MIQRSEFFNMRQLNSLVLHRYVVLGGLIAVTVDNLNIRADPVFRYCYNWVSGDERVQNALGDGLKAGDLRSYRLDSGKFELSGVRPVWRPPRIQVSKALDDG